MSHSEKRSGPGRFGPAQRKAVGWEEAMARRQPALVGPAGSLDPRVAVVDGLGDRLGVQFVCQGLLVHVLPGSVVPAHSVESCEATLNPTATGRTQIGMLLSMNVSPSSASSRVVPMT